MRIKKRKKTSPMRYVRKAMRWMSASIRNVLIVLLLFLLVSQWLKIDFIGKLRQKIDAERPLKENESGRISGDTKAKRIVLQEKGKETKIYEGVRKFEASKLNDGDIKVKVKNRGLGLEPGFAVGVGDGLRLGADVQYAYWKRWGLVAGATLPVENRTINKVRGHAGIAYSPYFKYAPSTSLFGGIDTNKSPIIGIRTEF